MVLIIFELSVVIIISAKILCFTFGYQCLMSLNVFGWMAKIQGLPALQATMLKVIHLQFTCYPIFVGIIIHNCYLCAPFADRLNQ